MPLARTEGPARHLGEYVIRLSEINGPVFRCYVCPKQIRSGKNGKLWLEAVTVMGTTDCVWGPVPVNPDWQGVSHDPVRQPPRHRHVRNTRPRVSSGHALGGHGIARPNDRQAPPLTVTRLDSRRKALLTDVQAVLDSCDWG